MNLIEKQEHIPDAEFEVVCERTSEAVRKYEDKDQVCGNFVDLII